LIFGSFCQYVLIRRRLPEPLCAPYTVAALHTATPREFRQRPLIPKAVLLEMRVALCADGSLRDVRQVLTDLVETANAQLPFAYRIDRDGDTVTLVATRTRDEQGRSVDLTPIRDRHITIPL
jgi:hypothetical protein